MHLNPSFWMTTTGRTEYPSLEEDVFADVTIVGGGMTGLTCAYLLADRGQKVVLLEKDRIAEGETGKTTAHLTEILDDPFSQVITDFGQDGARLAAEAGRAAIDFIQTISDREGIACEFSRLPAFIYSESGHDGDELVRELEAARKIGVECSAVENPGLPFAVHGALRVENQAQFHPRRYLLGLAERARAKGAMIFEGSPVLKVEEGDPSEVTTERGVVRAKRLIVAANVPINNRFSMHTRLFPYRSYAIAVRSPHAATLHGLYWDTMDPYHYTRVARLASGDPVLIIGGEDHKTGTREHTEKCYRQLETFARERFGATEVLNRWSGQIIEPADGLPYIGRNPYSKETYIASGYSGQGMTFGTFAGMLLSDLATGRHNRWEGFFSPKRFKPLASAGSMIRENKDYPLHMLKDRWDERDALGVQSVPVGEGKVVRIGQEPVAVYRDDESQLHAVSPVCPHMGCHVHFNRAEKSWDCPCHGSRFAVDGSVLNGPALQPLTPVDLKEVTEKERRDHGKNVPGEAA